MRRRNRCAVFLFAALAGVNAQAQPAANDGSLRPVEATTLFASGIPSSDLERSIAFYTKGLGLKALRRIEMGNVIEVPILLPGGTANLMLLHSRQPGAQLAPRTMHNRIILVSPDLKALVARLNAAGYQLKGKLYENAQYKTAIAQIEDPDGNHIELIQRLP